MMNRPTPEPPRSPAMPSLAPFPVLRVAMLGVCLALHAGAPAAQTARSQ